MQEKNHAQMLEDQQRAEMDKMAYELEKKMNKNQSSNSNSPSKNSLANDSRFFNNIKLSLGNKTRPSIRDVISITDSMTERKIRGANPELQRLLPEVKVFEGHDFDTASRLNSKILKTHRDRYLANKEKEGNNKFSIDSDF